jgi:hypothetical protein
MTNITIKNFKVIDSTSGKIQQTGRRELNYLQTILSSKTFITDLVERTAIPGTPGLITGGDLVNKAHMGTKYIEILNEYGTTGIDKIIIPAKIRFTKVTGTSSAQNMICYGWASALNTPVTDITWNVLFANFNAQTQGDYIDIDLPDRTRYPKLFLALILINDAWSNKTIVNESLKICSVPGNLDYFCINPDKSKVDVGDSHCVNIQGFSSLYGVQNRISVAFEDWYMAQTDKDYNDVVISIQDAYLDDNNVNDTSIS